MVKYVVYLSRVCLYCRFEIGLPQIYNFPFSCNTTSNSACLKIEKVRKFAQEAQTKIKQDRSGFLYIRVCLHCRFEIGLPQIYNFPFSCNWAFNSARLKIEKVRKFAQEAQTKIKQDRSVFLYIRVCLYCRFEIGLPQIYNFFL